MSTTLSPKAVVMIRPRNFHPNPETATDNAFQRSASPQSGDVGLMARKEFDSVVKTLRSNGVEVHVFDETAEQDTPDCVFPNNWFSTHHGGHVAIYPMYSQNRRRERRTDVIDMLKVKYRVQDVVDYSGLEEDELFLEGTGAMVLDHIDRVAYTANSNRANPIVLERFCSHFKYEPMAFDAFDQDGSAIYHTNVMMCIASNFVLIGSHMISDTARRDEVVERLKNTGREVIELTANQIKNFLGNALELTGENGQILALSQTAYNALTPNQILIIQQSVKLVPLQIPTIELAGGSVRCMLAEIHLPKR